MEEICILFFCFFKQIVSLFFGGVLFLFSFRGLLVLDLTSHGHVGEQSHTLGQSHRIYVVRVTLITQHSNCGYSGEAC